jgi:hypothetical protein
MFWTLFNYAKTIVGICNRDQGPQDVPSSTAIIVFGFIAAFTFAAVTYYIRLGGVGRALCAAFIDSLQILALGCIPLMMRGLRNRIPQTLAALAGVAAAVYLLTALGLGSLSLAPEMQDLAKYLGWVVTVPMVIWWIIISMFVLQHALSISRRNAFLLTLFSFLFFDYTLIPMFCGPALQAPAQL